MNGERRDESVPESSPPLSGEQERVKRLRAWAESDQVSARTHRPQYANPSELKRDILVLLSGWSARESKLREALTYYAERRNHTTVSDGKPYLWGNDSYDDQGPGARARAALNTADCPAAEEHARAEHLREAREHQEEKHGA